MNIKSITAVIFTLFYSIANAFDFKGIDIGMPTSAADVYQKAGVNCDRHNTGEEFQCSGYTTIAEVRSFINVRVGADGTTKSISLIFDANEFSKVETSLIHKFGKPRTKNSIVQNKMGAQYNQISHSWTKDGNELVAEKYGTTVDKSFVGFLSKSAIAELSKEISTPSNDL